jgi:hypothetical protein
MPRAHATLGFGDTLRLVTRQSWAASVAIVVLLDGAHAFACDSVSNPVLLADGSHTGAAPGPAGDATYTVKRGQGPRSNGCSQSLTSCDGDGQIGLHFRPSTDSESGPGDVGYRIEVVAGSAPASIDIVTDPIVPTVAGNEATIYLDWDDGSTDDQESIDFSITLTPVDRNGNEGPTSAPIHVHDGGSGGGCAIERRREADTRAAMAALAVTMSPFLRRRWKRRSVVGVVR